MKNILNIKLDDDYKFQYKKDFKKILNIYIKEFNIKTKISVDLLITNNSYIRKINKIYRSIDKSTDILSFPLDNFINSSFFKHRSMGEIIISYEKLISQAKKFGHSEEREFCYMFIHGMVHLNGMDHKKNKREEKDFNIHVNNIINVLGISR